MQNNISTMDADESVPSNGRPRRQNAGSWRKEALFVFLDDDTEFQYVPDINKIIPKTEDQIIGRVMQIQYDKNGKFYDAKLLGISEDRSDLIEIKSRYIAGRNKEKNLSNKTPRTQDTGKQSEAKSKKSRQTNEDDLELEVLKILERQKTSTCQDTAKSSVGSGILSPTSITSQNRSKSPITFITPTSPQTSSSSTLTMGSLSTATDNSKVVKQPIIELLPGSGVFIGKRDLLKLEFKAKKEDTEIRNKSETDVAVKTKTTKLPLPDRLIYLLLSHFCEKVEDLDKLSGSGTKRTTKFDENILNTVEAYVVDKHGPPEKSMNRLFILAKFNVLKSRNGGKQRAQKDNISQGARNKTTKNKINRKKDEYHIVNETPSTSTLNIHQQPSTLNQPSASFMPNPSLTSVLPQNFPNCYPNPSAFTPVTPTAAGPMGLASNYITSPNAVVPAPSSSEISSAAGTTAAIDPYVSMSNPSTLKNHMAVSHENNFTQYSQVNQRSYPQYPVYNAQRSYAAWVQQSQQGFPSSNDTSNQHHVRDTDGYKNYQ